MTHRDRSFWLSAALLSTFFLASPSTYAQAPSADRTAAMEAYDRGRAASNRGDYEAARAYFVQAYAVSPTPDCLWSLAVAERKGGRLADALKHLRNYLVDPSPAAATYKERARAFVAEISGHLRVDAQGRPVRVDGEPLSDEQLQNGVDVLPGKHRVEVGTQSREVQVTIGNASVVAFTESPAPRPVKTTAAGTDQDVDAALDRATHAPTPVTESNPTRTWVTVGLGVGAAALLGTGIFFSVKSSSTKDDADNLRNAQAPGACASAAGSGCSALADKVHDANSQYTTSVLLYGGAGLLAAGAVASWFLIPTKRETRSATSPLVAPGLLGASWTTTF